MRQVRDVIKLHSDMGLSLRKIEGATNVARSTVGDYIKRFKSLGLSLEQIDKLHDDTLKLKFFPEVDSVVVSRKALLLKNKCCRGRPKYLPYCLL